MIILRVSEHGIDEFSHVILFDSFTFKHLNIKPIHKIYVNTGSLKKKGFLLMSKCSSLDR